MHVDIRCHPPTGNMQHAAWQHVSISTCQHACRHQVPSANGQHATCSMATCEHLNMSTCMSTSGAIRQRATCNMQHANMSAWQHVDMHVDIRCHPPTGRRSSRCGSAVSS